MKYCLKFSKVGYIRYTSHLDLLRLFQRSFKRAGIHLLYSNGFNPHPKLSFAQPLSLGYESLAEYLDFETKDDKKTGGEIALDLAAIMPEGLDILECWEIGKGHPTLAAITEYGAYEATLLLPDLPDRIQQKAAEFLHQDAILVSKEQKKTHKILEFDCKDRISSFECKIGEEGELLLKFNIRTGSTDHLSPDLLLAAFCRFARIPYEKAERRILRTELFYSKDGEKVPLSSHGKE